MFCDKNKITYFLGSSDEDDTEDNRHLRRLKRKRADVDERYGEFILVGISICNYIRNLTHYLI